MKKLLVFVVALALVVWVVSWFRTPDAVATSAARPWPGEMGRLDATPGRWPPQEANAASKKFMELAGRLTRNDAVEGFVGREIERGELRIGGAPALDDVKPLRDLLLSQPIVWERHFEIGGEDVMNERGAQMTAARALIASALSKGHAGDATAWDDLHAVWKLARTLDEHPLMSTQTAALSMARMVNAVAWKMPLPAPEWLGELQERDPVRPLLESFQYQAASYWKDGAQMFPTKWLASSVENDRSIAEELVKTTQCDVSPRPNQLGVDLTFVWRRAFRYRAEREASVNALRVREGKPIEPASRCSDGSWQFDGKALRFSREIAMAAPDRAMPLVLQIKP